MGMGKIKRCRGWACHLLALAQPTFHVLHRHATVCTPAQACSAQSMGPDALVNSRRVPLGVKRGVDRVVSASVAPPPGPSVRE